MFLDDDNLDKLEKKWGSYIREKSTRARSNMKLKKRTKERKISAVALKGGKCEICGGSFAPCSFDFHHPDPDEKTMNISAAMTQYNNERYNMEVIPEIMGCHLLCSNCHRVVHWDKQGTLIT